MTYQHNKRFLVGTALGIALAIRVAPPALAQALAQAAASCSLPAIETKQVCAVENVIQAREGIPCEHDGKTYWVCCPRCVDAFKENPDAYRLATDPVSGERVDKATALVQPYAGRVFFFASEATRTAFLKEPERWDHRDERSLHRDTAKHRGIDEVSR